MEPGHIIDALILLLRLLEHAGYAQVDDFVVSRWRPEVLPYLLAQGLLEPAGISRTIVCDGCERGCLVSPTLRRQPDGTSIYVNACVQHRFGLLRFSPERMRRWRLVRSGLVHWLTRELNLSDGPAQLLPELWRLGSRSLDGAHPTFYFTWGFGLEDAADRAVRTRLRLSGSPAVLLIPQNPPMPHVWPDPPPVFAVVDLLCADAEGTPHLESRRLAGAVQRVQPHRRPGLSRIVPLELRPGLRWSDVTIRVVDDQTLEIVVGNRVERRTFIEAGMADQRRSPPEPSSQWKLLLTLARTGQGRPWEEASATPDLRYHVSQLRKTLKKLIPIAGSPLDAYRPARGWQPRFNLVDLRR